MRSILCPAAALLGLMISMGPGGCAPQSRISNLNGVIFRRGVRLRAVLINNPLDFTAVPSSPITLSAARNEWVGFLVQIDGLPKPASKHPLKLRIAPTAPGTSHTSLPADAFSAAQVLPMPVDLNQADFVRQTGLHAPARPLPRALLPLAMRGGVVDLSVVRDPRHPTNPRSRGEGSGQPLLVWIDLHIPPDTPAGDFATSLDIVAVGERQPLASVPLHITVFDFSIPNHRALVMTSRIEWEDLRRLYPRRFETVTPRLMNRTDPRYAGAVAVLDSLIKLAERNRVEVVVPRLQPTVKWPADSPPAIDWSDLDSLLSPWLDGPAFADKAPLGYWPLPQAEQLDRYDRTSQLQYWKQAADHFDSKNWLTRTPVTLERPPSTRAATDGQDTALCAQAARILSDHPHLRIALPLRADQIHFADASNPGWIDPHSTARLRVTAPGIVFNPPIQPWPANAARPAQWLRADAPDAPSCLGAGIEEHNARAWAWLAFLRSADMIQWGSPLPHTNDPTDPSGPDDLIWFYPGIWFGVDEPVPTLQLKWLRRAEQDYEYLRLAARRGHASTADTLARLLTRPVEIQPGHEPDPAYDLLTGTADPSVWTEAQQFLTRCINLPPSGSNSPTSPAANALNLDLLRWTAAREHALLMASSAQWGFGPRKDHWIDLTLGVDIYNDSSAAPVANQLRWTDPNGQSHLPEGWQVRPQPMAIPPLSNYCVQRFSIPAQFDLNRIDAKDHRPAELTFVNGDNNATSTLRFVLPVAPTDRLGPGLNIEDANLNDWKSADMIQNGPMVRMLNRPTVQKQQIQYATDPAQIYTGWGDDDFYVAFRLQGAQPRANRLRNFVTYQCRRAWGDDCCELLVQPVFLDNSLGPVLHIVCKPDGQWIERRPDGRHLVDSWQPLEGAAIRYSSAVTSVGEWTGELAIPWISITARDHNIPPLLRFNVTQHVNATGESASWAGPIDYGRDEAFMGLLYVRDLGSD